MVDITVKPRRNFRQGEWLQTTRESHERWARLIKKSPLAASILHLLAAEVDGTTAIVISQAELARRAEASERGVRNAMKILTDEDFVEVVQIGVRGSVAGYKLDSRVAWYGQRDGLLHARFNATVLTSSAEQPDAESLGRRQPLHRLPRGGEMQVAHGAGLPPVSQPFFDGMEPDLPAMPDGGDD